MLKKTIDKYHKQKIRSRKVFVCVLCVCLLLLLALTFDIYFSLWNVISFVILFVGLPFLFFLRFRKNEGIKWYVLVSILVSIPFLVLIYCNNLLLVNNNFDTYLTGDSKFVNAAETVLPSKDSLSERQILFFEHLYCLDKEYELYRFAVRYTGRAFDEEKGRLQEQYETNARKFFVTNPDFSDDDFFFDGARYSCYTFSADGAYYAMAYDCCEETNTVSYIFFTDRYGLSSMDAGSALHYFYIDVQYDGSKHIVSEV